MKKKIFLLVSLIIMSLPVIARAELSCTYDLGNYGYYTITKKDDNYSMKNNLTGDSISLSGTGTIGKIGENKINYNFKGQRYNCANPSDCKQFDLNKVGNIGFIKYAFIVSNGKCPVLNFYFEQLENSNDYKLSFVFNKETTNKAIGTTVVGNADKDNVNIELDLNNAVEEMAKKTKDLILNENNRTISWKLTKMMGSGIFRDILNGGNKVTASDDINICSSESRVLLVFKLVGYFIATVKILVPIILIGFAIIDFSKVILSGKDDDLKNAMTSVMRRTISGIVVFFVPTLVYYAVSLINNSINRDDPYFNNCNKCIFKVDQCPAKKIGENKK